MTEHQAVPTPAAAPPVPPPVPVDHADLAIERLHRAIHLVDGPCPDATLALHPRAVCSPFWYRAMYQLTVEAIHRLERGSTPMSLHPDAETAPLEARTIARCLACVLEVTLDGCAPGAGDDPTRAAATCRPDPHLCHFLERFEGTVLTVLSAVLVRDDPPSVTAPAPFDSRRRLAEAIAGNLVGAADVMHHVEKRTVLTPRTMYNLACNYASLALRTEDAAVRAQQAEQAISYLEDAWPALESSVRGWAPHDPSLRPLHDEDPSPDPRRSLEPSLRESLLARWNLLMLPAGATHSPPPEQIAG